MYSFTPNVNKESMERACAEYQNPRIMTNELKCALPENPRLTVCEV